MVKLRAYALPIIVLTGVACTFLAGCGRQLGEYRFDGADPADVAAAEKIDRDISGYPAGSRAIRIRFSSAVDLEELTGGHDLYVHADFCPFKRRYMIDVWGPFYSDQSRYVFSGVPPEVVQVKYRHPPRDERTGRYLYTAYVLPARPMPGVPPTVTNLPDHDPYNLRTAHRDVCLRIDSPGYYITPSQSNVFVVPASAIDAVLTGAGG
jgi:hypothetical protein